ncbi:hypothetical protein PHYSODRAFT_384739, partial [Phytophthora sojae]
AEPTLAVYAADGEAAFEGGRSEVPSETTYVLPLDTKCELIGSSVVETPEEEVLLIMPELPGTTLLQFLRQRRRKSGRKLNEEEARRLLEKVATLLQAVHKSGVVHCDLNLENVLVSSDISQAWLIDFGGARGLLDGSSSSAQVMTGTPGYVAPERVQDPLALPTPQADVFSLGILL